MLEPPEFAPKFHSFPVTDPAFIALEAMSARLKTPTTIVAMALSYVGRMIWRQDNMLCSCNGSQVSGITAPGFAKVMQMQVGRPEEQLPDHSMDIDGTLRSAHHAISVDSNVPEPKPATGIWLDVNLLLKTLWERRNCDVHNPAPVWPKGCAGAIFL